MTGSDVCSQVRYVTGMFITLFLAVLYNLFLPPSNTTRSTRLTVGLIWGIMIGWLVYESAILQLIILPMLCYFLIYLVPSDIIHRYTFILTMTWLSVNHIYHQITDYGGYRQNVTGPLMVITQRLTYVAYSLHDGLCRNANELTIEQRQHCIKEKPTMLEFFSYNLHFTMFLVGPSCTYYEFIQFIDGNNMKGYKGLYKIPVITVAMKIFKAITYLGLYVLGGSLLSVYTCIDSTYRSKTPLLTKIVHGYLVIGAVKMRYYFAWTFGDGVINAAGMGFNGYDKNGEQRWDAFTNIKVKNIELATNARTILENWNICTEKWLKRIIYFRAKNKVQGVMTTAFTSALFHGFYPGYYLCFISTGLITISSRTARHSFWAFFQESKRKKIFYDILTWCITNTLVSYCVLPFMLLRLEYGIIFWRSMYFFGHFVSILGFASPWISKMLGMWKDKKLEERQKETKTEAINGRRIIRNIDDDEKEK
ncbi:lysophospholipid acyltransferase 2-like isoform X2 [Xenia sp. Carnegie-2017]|uniref:lysophospholipid acyltransferase 2-like isoform X2 n=1 Tax=Xenia sp. Carnegie-2017 TaxID=2897299 RepID=UPI001F040DB9|nr:lysophospholipid acyltransferase 2-like isoform X2 [Xenia sp. Carnegie-2017]